MICPVCQAEARRTELRPRDQATVFHHNDDEFCVWELNRDRKARLEAINDPTRQVSLDAPIVEQWALLFADPVKIRGLIYLMDPANGVC